MAMRNGGGLDDSRFRLARRASTERAKPPATAGIGRRGRRR
jgi:hypothetical protein